MKFILRDYLASLKEDGELDTFIFELSRSMGLVPLSKTQRGRQDGVDICAVGEDEDKVRKVFLFVIKQGNFSRNTWNSGRVNDIQPTLEEVKLVYINTRIPARFQTLKKKIVVCCNGFIEQTIDQAWALYTTLHTSEAIEFDFWGIDKLTELAEIRQLNELILSPELTLQFRRSLSFIDLPDYNLFHFYNFLDLLLPRAENRKPRLREAIKKLRLLRLCMTITHSWCEKSNNLKPAYILSERILLASWGWLQRNELLTEKKLLLEYYYLTISWENLGHRYMQKVRQYFLVPDGLGAGVPDHNEYCLVTYEQIGIVSTIGMFQVWHALNASASPDSAVRTRGEEAMRIATVFGSDLALLIQQNPAAYNPRFDEHCIEVNMGLSLLFQTGYKDAAAFWLKSLIEYLSMNYQTRRFFPLLVPDTKLLLTPDAEPVKSSVLLTILAEWCLILKQPLLYQGLREVIATSFPNVNLQLWFPEPGIDERLFYEEVSNDGGSMLTGILLQENIKEFEMWMTEEREQFKAENDSSIFAFGFDFLLPIANRHFRTYPFPNSWRVLLGSAFCFEVPGTEKN